VSSEAEENKAIVRRFLEEHMVKGNLDVIDELAAPDFVDRSLLPGQGPTREDFKGSVAQILEAFPITNFTIEEQIAEGETVVTKYRQSSVHRGEYYGLPPTGKETTEEGIYIHRISGGKITEEWSIIPIVRQWRISRRRYVSASAWSRTLGWRDESSRPHSPRRCPHWRAGRSLPTTSLLGR
jgi:predicted ester cyclase